MTDTQLTWSPGPPPPADGLRSAFHAADRRRARTALAAVAPIVVAAALAMTTTMQTGGTDSLQLPPAKHVTVTDDRQAPDASQADTPAAAGSAPRLAPVAPTAAVGDSPGAAGSHSAAARPAPAPAARAEGGELVFTAARTAVTTLRVSRLVHPDLDRASYARHGSYAGVWLLDRKGAVVGSAFAVWDATGIRAYSTSVPQLAAGTYTVYVVGDRPAEVHVPLGKNERGQTVTATKPGSATYSTTSHTTTAIDTGASLRLHIPSASPAIGYAGGFIDTRQGGASSTVTVCLPRRDAQCSSGDPQDTESSSLNVGGGYGSAFRLTRRLVADKRDVLLDTDVYGTGSVVTCWAITLTVT